jgi:hypothetical protein
MMHRFEPDMRSCSCGLRFVEFRYLHDHITSTIRRSFVQQEDTGHGRPRYQAWCESEAEESRRHALKQLGGRR